MQRIGFIVLPSFQMLSVAALSVFELANSEIGEPVYNVHLLSASGGRVTSSSSVHVCTESVEARRQVDKLHALFITGGKGLHRSLHDVRLIDWLRMEETSTAIRHRLLATNAAPYHARSGRIES